MFLDYYRMSLRNAIIVGAVFCTSTALGGKPHVGSDVSVVDIQVRDDGALERLATLDDLEKGMEIWTEIPRPGLNSVRADRGALAAITAAGFEFQVTVPDLQARIEESFGEEGEGEFFDDLRTYHEHSEFIQQLAAQYPDLAEVFPIGESVLGRRILCLRVGTNRGTVPGVVYHGAQHGNEPAGASVVSYIANHLLSNYGLDEYVTGLVDDIDWFLIPIMNPDGYVEYSRHNANDVDLNRDWGGPGTAEGWSFTQPETVAMRDLFLSNPNVKGHIDFHGYIRWLMWPWGHTSTHSPLHEVFGSVVSGVAERISEAGGGDYDQGSVWDVAYPVVGGSIDYTHGELGVWAFGFELADDWVPGICEEFLAGSLFVAESLYGCLEDGFTSDPSLDCNMNGFTDACDISMGAFLDIDENGVINECEPFTHSVPANGSVDARQPSNVAGTFYYPFAPVRLYFPYEPEELSISDFAVSIDPPGLIPSITNVYTQGDEIILVFGQGGLLPPRALLKWTTIVHLATGASTTIGYLPGDVSGDGHTSPTDILALIDSLNGISSLPTTSTDIDRSSQANPADVLRLIDLLNGAGEFDVWNGASLP